MSDDILQALGEELREREQQVERGDAPPELVEPLDSSERMAVLDGAFGRLEREQASEPEGDAETESPEEVVDLSSARRSRRSLLPIAGVVLAAAAAVLLWWGMPRPSGDPAAALPTYALSRLDAGDAVVRSAPKAIRERIELRSDGRVTMVLTPATPVSQAVDVVLVARPSEGRSRLARPVEGVQISKNGAVRLDGPLDQLIALEPGDWTLELLVGSPSALPRDLADLRDASETPPWRTVVVHATIIE